MKVEIIYPPAAPRRRRQNRLPQLLRWPMVFAALVCPVLNWVTGGPAWSLVVLMSLYMAWTLVLSPALVEYNRISQSIRWIVCSCVLLTLIDLLLAPGWAIEVVPIVCFCGLALAGTLFFTDLERQKQNMLPLLLFILLTLAGAVAGLCFWHEESRWALAVMGVCSLTLLAACVTALGRDFVREVRRRFHTR